jgi:hypothetical protein
VDASALKSINPGSSLNPGGLCISPDGDKPTSRGRLLSSCHGSARCAPAAHSAAYVGYVADTGHAGYVADTGHAGKVSPAGLAGAGYVADMGLVRTAHHDGHDGQYGHDTSDVYGAQYAYIEGAVGLDPSLEPTRVQSGEARGDGGGDVASACEKEGSNQSSRSGRSGRSSTWLAAEGGSEIAEVAEIAVGLPVTWEAHQAALAAQADALAAEREQVRLDLTGHGLA